MGPGVTPDLATSPLAHRAGDFARLAEDTRGAIAAIEIPFLAQVDLRVDEATARAAALLVPFAPNTVLRHELRAALWLGPDEWLVIGAAGTQTEIVEELASALDDAHASVIDVSASRAVLDLSGPRALDVLATGCPIDLHPRSWRPGMCAQTLFDRTPVLLEHLRHGTMRIYVRPSFADDLVDRLIARRPIVRRPSVP
jgi:sarcosine oxidase subunit gamma